MFDNVSPQQRLRLLQPGPQRVPRVDAFQHFAHLAHEVDRLVEGHDEVALRELDLFADLGHSGAAAPGASGAIEVGVVPFGDGETFAPLFAQGRVLDVFDAPPRQDQPVGQDEAVAEAELAVEGKPGEDFGQVLRLQAVEDAAVDHLAEDQAVVVEDLGQHVGLFRRIAAMQVAEAVEHIADAANDVAQPFLFEVDFAAKGLFQSATLRVEAIDLRQIVAMLLAPGTLVAGVLLSFCPQGR